jgi:hypothetical protein
LSALGIESDGFGVITTSPARKASLLLFSLVAHSIELGGVQPLR